MNMIPLTDKLKIKIKNLLFKHLKIWHTQGKSYVSEVRNYDLNYI